MSKDGQEHLKARLNQFIKDLKSYELRLLQKLDLYPSFEDEIYLLVERIQLEVSHFEEELEQLHQAGTVPETRLRHKLSIFMGSYSKLVESVNACLLARPTTAQKNSQPQQPMSFRRDEPKRLKNIRGFIEELNNSWMLDLLNKHKVKPTPKAAPAPTKKKEPAQSKVKPEKRKQGLLYLNKELMCLNSLTDNLHNNYEVHRHRELEDQLLSLKDEEANLMRGLTEAKESNQLLREQYEQLQKQLTQLRVINSAISTRFFEVKQ